MFLKGVFTRSIEIEKGGIWLPGKKAEECGGWFVLENLSW